MGWHPAATVGGGSGLTSARRPIPGRAWAPVSGYQPRDGFRAQWLCHSPDWIPMRRTGPDHSQSAAGSIQQASPLIPWSGPTL